MPAAFNRLHLLLQSLLRHDINTNRLAPKDKSNTVEVPAEDVPAENVPPVELPAVEASLDILVYVPLANFPSVGGSEEGTVDVPVVYVDAPVVDAPVDVSVDVPSVEGGGEITVDLPVVDVPMVKVPSVSSPAIGGAVVVDAWEDPTQKVTEVPTQLLTDSCETCETAPPSNHQLTEENISSPPENEGPTTPMRDIITEVPLVMTPTTPMTPREKVKKKREVTQIADPKSYS